jgi:hypothetical protein
MAATMTVMQSAIDAVLDAFGKTASCRARAADRLSARVS